MVRATSLLDTQYIIGIEHEQTTIRWQPLHRLDGLNGLSVLKFLLNGNHHMYIANHGAGLFSNLWWPLPTQRLKSCTRRQSSSFTFYCRFSNI